MESRKNDQSKEACNSVSLTVLSILLPTISNSHSILYCQAHSSPLIGDGSSRVLRLLLILCSRLMAKRKRLYLRLSLQSAWMRRAIMPDSRFILLIELCRRPSNLREAA